MVSPARENFLTGLNAFGAACDEPAVIAASEVGGFLRRGMTVAAFNLLETFLDDRLQELAHHVNGGATQFLDLPERLQKRSISQTLEVANARLRRGSYTVNELRAFSGTVGQSLSAVGSAMSVSPFTWLWSGSNVTADDLTTMLSFFQVDRPWDSVRHLAAELGFVTIDAEGDPLNLKDDLQALAAERHRSAHVASHAITSLWLRAVPDRILRLAIALDILVSSGAHLLRTGDSNVLAGKKWDPTERISIRFVRQRTRDFAEFVGSSKKAYRVSHDGDRLYADATGRCAQLEVAVRQSISREIVAWSIPAVS